MVNPQLAKVIVVQGKYGLREIAGDVRKCGELPLPCFGGRHEVAEFEIEGNYVGAAVSSSDGVLQPPPQKRKAPVIYALSSRGRGLTGDLSPPTVQHCAHDAHCRCCRTVQIGRDCGQKCENSTGRSLFSWDSARA